MRTHDARVARGGGGASSRGAGGGGASSRRRRGGCGHRSASRTPCRHRHALAWLKLAFPLAHKDSDTKHWIKRLLAVDYFTANMKYMQILEPLQTFCGERLLLAGAPLQTLFQNDGDVRGLGLLRSRHLACPDGPDRLVGNGNSVGIGHVDAG